MFFYEIRFILLLSTDITRVELYPAHESCHVSGNWEILIKPENHYDIVHRKIKIYLRQQGQLMLYVLYIIQLNALFKKIAYI